jgi:hypothetical protein
MPPKKIIGNKVYKVDMKARRKSNTRKINGKLRREIPDRNLVNGTRNVVVATNNNVAVGGPMPPPQFVDMITHIIKRGNEAQGRRKTIEQNKIRAKYGLGPVDYRYRKADTEHAPGWVYGPPLH